MITITIEISVDVDITDELVRAIIEDGQEKDLGDEARVRDLLEIAAMQGINDMRDHLRREYGVAL